MQLAESKDMLFFLDAYTGTSNLGSQEGMNMNMLFFSGQALWNGKFSEPGWFDAKLPAARIPGHLQLCLHPQLCSGQWSAVGLRRVQHGRCQ